jgi:cytochrome c-type biogenesis protein CcmH
MLFWLICAAMTAAALYVVARPLMLPAPDGTSVEHDAAADVSVYRDQLNEIESDHARGLMTDSEVAAARVEISRRLLARAARPSETHAGEKAVLPGAQRMFAATAICVPLVAMALYLAHGSPGMPDFPHSLQASAPTQNASVTDLIAKVEARLQSHPEDGQGWDVIAPVYLRQGRFSDAAQAFQRAIRILGETPRRLAGLGEASVLAANGVVTEEAKSAFLRLRKLEPTWPEPRFWLALASEQDGDLKTALAEYRTLLAEAPENATWRGTLEERIALLTPKVEGTTAAPGPTADDVAAADKLTAAERTAMIDQMVAGLAERLKNNGQDLDGWQRLVRAYVVLGRKQQAVDALSEARKAMAGNDNSLAALSELARSLGLGS